MIDASVRGSGASVPRRGAGGALGRPAVEPDEHLSREQPAARVEIVGHGLQRVGDGGAHRSRRRARRRQVEKSRADPEPLRLGQNEEAAEEPPVPPQQPAAPADDLPAAGAEGAGVSAGAGPTGRADAVERAVPAPGELLDDRLGHPEALGVVAQHVEVRGRLLVLVRDRRLTGGDQVRVERRAEHRERARQVPLLRPPVGHLDRRPSCRPRIAHRRYPTCPPASRGRGFPCAGLVLPLSAAAAESLGLHRSSPVLAWRIRLGA